MCVGGSAPDRSGSRSTADPCDGVIEAGEETAESGGHEQPPREYRTVEAPERNPVVCPTPGVVPWYNRSDLRTSPRRDTP